jgi:hypothetical protein
MNLLPCLMITTALSTSLVSPGSIQQKNQDGVSVTDQGKQIEKKKLDVKGAGISMMVPKKWSSFSDRAGNVASYRLPSTDKKSEPRLDIGLDFGEGEDVAAFQSGVSTILSTRGDTLIEQYILDVMGGKFAFTKYSRDGRTTLRGVLFRTTKQKLVMSLNTPSEEFEQHYPLFKEVIESFNETRVVEQRPVNQGPVEKTISLRVPEVISKKKAKQTFTAVARGVDVVVSLPTKCKISKLSDSSYTIKSEELDGEIIVDLDRAETEAELVKKPNAFFEQGLTPFVGGIYRVDKYIFNSAAADRIDRAYVRRTGISAVNNKELATLQCASFSTEGVLVSATYQVINFKRREEEFRKAEQFLNYLSYAKKK